MGFRKWLLGFYPREFEDVKRRLEDLESKVEKVNTVVESMRRELKELYESKADVILVKSLEEELSAIGHVKKGRTKYYYVIEAKDEFVRSEDYV
jgi:chromosome segregation ATPase